MEAVLYNTLTNTHVEPCRKKATNVGRAAEGRAPAFVEEAGPRVWGAWAAFPCCYCCTNMAFCPCGTWAWAGLTPAWRFCPSPTLTACTSYLNHDEQQYPQGGDKMDTH